MKKLLFSLLVIPVLLLAGCESSPLMEPPSNIEPTKEKAEIVLESLGYTDIDLLGTAWFGCSEDDSLFASYHFSAMDEDRLIKGTVCCGSMFDLPFVKGCTIRY